MPDIICKCKSVVPSNRKDCPACGRDCGFPNVRLASSSEEVAALEKRVADAQVSAAARQCGAQLASFAESVEGARAAIARNLHVIDDLIKGDRNHYTSYQAQVHAGARDPEENEWDRVRTQYESALYPNFQNEIIFACLTLSQEGMSGYGGFSIILKDEMIAHRASLFEENPHSFIERHQILMNKPFPPGYRAIWETKSDLAVAKLHSRIDSNTTIEDHASILQTDQGGTGDGDFIEVHIYGSVNRRAIDKVVGRKPRTFEDRIIWKRIQRELDSLGAEAVEL
ncbi:hypothetical protein FHX14_002046 [Rhizobium sp. BK619]|uniref:hypothetical protein n=1 Tax=Rhizobium sp. BK619 TaxID=2586989 RepID=UPI00160BABAA|nr:hypothetical protein [Rhizobium sp. BK619]MBB3645867.1 hypothetical protein [Rhizobium sp. BK619]